MGIHYINGALSKRTSQTFYLNLALLQGLERNLKDDLAGALGFLQKGTKLHYLQAYQSLLWNKAVSYRIQKFGFQVLVGDLVLLPKAENIQDENAKTKEDSESVDDKLELREDKIVKVTEENLDQYTLNDIVMPIPGYKVSYPGKLNK